ncbi:MAG: DUF115 domain-containing protein [Candidatus Competibacteraceae bacterium]|nr:DUF115 domain-containing protein [Candidatus Competibacteraceae bacterium]
MQVSDWKDKYAGRIGFVAGAGPSLRMVNDGQLNKYGPTIAVNSAISKLTQADFFLADDIGVKHWNYYQHILPTTDAVSFLDADKLVGEAHHLNQEKVVWFNRKWWFDPKNNVKNPVGLDFTKDEPIIGSRTAAGSAVHLLYIMGCDPIVLIGCDCCYKENKRYYWQFKGEQSCYRLNGEKVFCHANRGELRGMKVDSHSVQFLEYWQAVAKSAKRSNVRIIDASEGLLDCFENKKLGEVLAEFGERKKDDRRP